MSDEPEVDHDIDLARAGLLLHVVEKATGHGPTLKALTAVAMLELTAMNGAAVEALKAKAEADAKAATDAKAKADADAAATAADEQAKLDEQQKAQLQPIPARRVAPSDPAPTPPPSDSAPAPASQSPDLTTRPAK